MEKNSEHIFHSLILTYLNSRAYYDTSTESCIASWSDEDEEERDKHKQITCMYNHYKILSSKIYISLIWTKLRKNYPLCF